MRPDVVRIDVLQFKTSHTSILSHTKDKNHYFKLYKELTVYCNQVQYVSRLPSIQDHVQQLQECTMHVSQ